MAKIDSSRLPSKKKFTVSIYDNQHRKNLALRAKKVTDLYDSVVASLTQQAALHFEGTKPNEEFDWKDYPQLQKLADKLIDDLGTSLQANIDEGCQEAWTLSDTKNDAMVDYLTQNYNLKQSVIDNLKRPHTEALAEYLKRRDEGMGLSDGTGNLKGVWNLGEFKSELELSLEACIGRGMSAADMSREIRQYLKYPDKLFRRVRDKETGALRLSKAAAAFHPGRGVYRSSYKNALRLTATENNIAYRSADYARWQNLDFVVGIEICISNNHPVNDICDELCGKYPKEFKFTGWHPWCRCFAVAILASDDECERYFKAIENGEDVSGWNFKEKVTDMPDAWNKWVSDNKERIANAKSLPYFIKDNFKNGDVSKGLVWTIAKKKTTVASKPTTQQKIQNRVAGYVQTQAAKDYETRKTAWTHKRNYHLETTEKRTMRNGMEYNCKIYTTPGGTKIVVPTNIPKSYHLTVQDVSNALEMLPVELKAQTKEVHLVNFLNPDDAIWKIRYKNFTQSYATGGNGTITFYKTPKGWTKADAIADLPFTLSHENGHNIDRYYEKLSGNKPSETNEWKNAIAADTKTSGKASMRTYGENSPHEDFADAFGYFVHKAEWFKKNFPARYKIISRILGIP